MRRVEFLVSYRKFLDVEEKKKVGMWKNNKATLLVHDHIIKGSSAKLPFATANEHLCMQVRKN